MLKKWFFQNVVSDILFVSFFFSTQDCRKCSYDSLALAFFKEVFFYSTQNCRKWKLFLYYLPLSRVIHRDHYFIVGPPSCPSVHLSVRLSVCHCWFYYHSFYQIDITLILLKLLKWNLIYGNNMVSYEDILIC